MTAAKLEKFSWGRLMPPEENQSNATREINNRAVPEEKGDTKRFRWIDSSLVEEITHKLDVEGKLITTEKFNQILSEYMARKLPESGGFSRHSQSLQEIKIQIGELLFQYLRENGWEIQDIKKQ